MQENNFPPELIAKKIKERGLKEAAILVLKLARPISPILANGLFLLEPFIGKEKTRPLTGLLDEPEELIALLEGESDE